MTGTQEAVPDRRKVGHGVGASLAGDVYCTRNGFRSELLVIDPCFFIDESYRVFDNNKSRLSE